MRPIQFEKLFDHTASQAGRLAGTGAVGHLTALSLGIAAPVPLIAAVAAPVLSTFALNAGIETVCAIREKRNPWQTPMPFPPLRAAHMLRGPQWEFSAGNWLMHTARMCLAAAALGCVGVSVGLSPVALGINMLVGYGMIALVRHQLPDLFDDAQLRNVPRAFR